ncbi:hypothetical protein [Lysinibacter sp. HNR]|uniref:hypothetical protein n=1 Tax=Lysinibacter sp. HNR TaxID=3031408 RepID=UPI00243528B1|nr:hypothetical protein [Lysinibacter sp. HNR]WGD37995.1 hypothetical protein FrondiHNR_03500 [Lysinibacter sp. HNR]
MKARIFAILGIAALLSTGAVSANALESGTSVPPAESEVKQTSTQLIAVGRGDLGEVTVVVPYRSAVVGDDLFRGKTITLTAPDGSVFEAVYTESRHNIGEFKIFGELPERGVTYSLSTDGWLATGSPSAIVGGQPLPGDWVFTIRWPL